jgi:hypothetical protein
MGNWGRLTGIFVIGMLYLLHVKLYEVGGDYLEQRYHDNTETRERQQAEIKKFQDSMNPYKEINTKSLFSTEPLEASDYQVKKYYGNGIDYSKKDDPEAWAKELKMYEERKADGREMVDENYWKWRRIAEMSPDEKRAYYKKLDGKKERKETGEELWRRTMKERDERIAFKKKHEEDIAFIQKNYDEQKQREKEKKNGKRKNRKNSN